MPAPEQRLQRLLLSALQAYQDLRAPLATSLTSPSLSTWALPLDFCASSKVENSAAVVALAKVDVVAEVVDRLM